MCPFCGTAQHEVSATTLSWAIGLAMLGAACGPAAGDSASSTGSAASSEASSEASSTSGGGTTTMAPTSSGSDGESSTSTGGTSSSSTECVTCSDSSEGGGFIYAAPDMGPPVKECDPWLQDCPEGEKCVPFVSTGGGAPDSLHCEPVAESPKQAGEPCTEEGWKQTHKDDCDFGLFCWIGTCKPLCTGTPDAPVCGDPASECLITNDDALTVCMPACDALAQDCEVDQVCLPIDDTQRFFCLPDASGDGGHEFDPCQNKNGCDPGLICLEATLAAECEGGGSCCLKLCDLTMPTCAGAGAECVPWYEPGMAPAGHEDVGVCRSPE